MRKTNGSKQRGAPGRRWRPVGWLFAILLSAGTGFVCPGRAETVVRPPVVRHLPPRTAVRGKALVLRAQVVPGAAPIRAVTLYGTTSRDVAPFPLPMTSAGAGAYVVTVPGTMIGEGEEFTYYIEAVDTLETAGETVWFTVRLHTPSGAGAREASAGSGLSEKPSRPGWVAPALIAGGATLIVGGAALAAHDSGGSGLGSPDPGTFSGSVTRILRVGETNTVTSNTATFVVTEDHRIYSQDLHPGTRMESTLSGSTFILTANVLVDGMEGQIRYVGSVAGEQIAGSVEGEVSSADGRNGVYSGSFTAARQ